MVLASFRVQGRLLVMGSSIKVLMVVVKGVHLTPQVFAQFWSIIKQNA